MCLEDKTYYFCCTMAISAENINRLVVLPILIVVAIVGIVYILYQTQNYENPYQKGICSITNATIVKNCYGDKCNYQGFITIEYQGPSLTLINILAVVKEKSQEKAVAEMTAKYPVDTPKTCYYPRYYYDMIRLDPYDDHGYYVAGYLFSAIIGLIGLLFLISLIKTIRQSYREYYTDNPHVRLP